MDSTVLSVTPAIPLFILVNPLNSSVLPGHTVNYKATEIFTDKTAQDVTANAAVWSSTNTNAATIVQTTGIASTPTMLTGVDRGMPAFDEEVFGPVAAVVRVRDEAEAVRVANASRYGLGASIWTGDPARGERLACELEVGSVFVNGLVKSDPRLPFGGVKRSGYGRELSEYGLREFVNVKTVWVA